MAWNSPLPVGTDGVTVTSAADLNKYRENLEYMRAPNNAEYVELNDSSNYTTTALTWAAISASYSLSITTTGGLVLVLLNLMVNNLDIDIEVDGTRLGTSGVSGAGVFSWPFGGSGVAVVNIPVLLDGPLSAASHTIKAMWKVPSAGTGTIYTQYRPRFRVRELG